MSTFKAVRLTIVACSLAFISFAAFCQEPPTDGRSCFCLRHLPTNQLLHGCTGFRRPPASTVTALCKDSEQDKKVSVVIQPPWAFVPSGAAGCNPCPAKTRKTEDNPRNGPGQ